MNLLALFGLLVPVAWALDGTGEHPAAGTGGIDDPLVAVHPARPDGVVEVGVVGELVDHPLTVGVTDGAETSEIEVIRSGIALDVLAAADVGRRLTLGVALPVWAAASGDLTEGAALGGARVEIGRAHV